MQSFDKFITKLFPSMNPAKKLKCAPPDLEVEVGTEKKIYQYNSVLLASCSAYVGSIMATPMQEQRTQRLTFPEISLDVWDKMIKFLENSGEGISFEDAAEVVPFYDKYQFVDAMEFVDKALAREASSWDVVSTMKNKSFYFDPHPMDLLIKRLRLSDQYSLQKTKKSFHRLACTTLQ